MTRKNFVLETLIKTGEVVFKPHGNSMTSKISSGDEVVVKKAGLYKVGDIVYVKVKGTYYLHLLSAIDESKDRYLISNNHGHDNGWVQADAIYGVCVKVLEKTLLTDDNLCDRMSTTNNVALNNALKTFESVDIL